MKTNYNFWDESNVEAKAIADGRPTSPDAGIDITPRIEVSHEAALPGPPKKKSPHVAFNGCRLGIITTMGAALAVAAMTTACSKKTDGSLEVKANERLAILNSAVRKFRAIGGEFEITSVSDSSETRVKITPITDSSDDEVAVLALLKERNGSLPGSPFISPSMAPVGNDSDDGYRMRWDGTLFELLKPGEAGHGLRFDLELRGQARTSEAKQSAQDRAFEYSPAIAADPKLSEPDEVAVEPVGAATLDVTGTDGGEPVRVGHALGLRSAEVRKGYQPALRFMMERVFDGNGKDISLNAFVTPEEALNAFWNGEIDVTEISSLDFALLPEIKRKRIKILCAVNLHSERFKNYSLMAAPGATLNDLKGQAIHVIGRGDWDLGRRWLDLIVIEKFGKPAAEFFGTITVIDSEKPGDVVLPTFFGKSKACLVMDHQVEQLVELNPAISQRLKPVITSPDFLGALFVVKADMGRDRIKSLQESAAKLHTTTDGQQVFELMSISRLFIPSHSDLESMREFAKRLMSQPESEFIGALPTGLD